MGVSNEGALLNSFLNGFKKTKASDVINGVYVAKTVFRIDFPFDFKDKGSLGVDSSKIRRIIFFSKTEPRKRNYDKIFRAAKQLSKIESEKLAWVAQYIMNGETHLYEQEAKEAMKIREKLSRIKI